MQKLFIICLFICGCWGCYGEEPPNIRTIPGIELCDQACNKLKELDVKHGDEDCKPYYEDITVDGVIYTCSDFCKYEMSRSVDLKTKCVLDNVEICSVDMSEKCGL